MTRYLLALLCVFIGIDAEAQLFQRIKGQVVDRETHAPLEGVIVTVSSLSTPKITSTDSAGWFVLDSIPVGKQDLLFSYPSYQSIPLNNVLITSGRETLL